MDLKLLRPFQYQVWVQCQFALRAADDLDAALRSPFDSNHVWYAIQNLLTATANIAKALWGAGGKLGPQREPLRRSIGVDDSSPLKDTAVRNHFEHFDERMDRWWAQSPAHGLVDMNIGIEAPGVPEIDVWRTYHPATGDLVFWGDRFNIPAIVAEVRRILPLVEPEAQKPHWVP
jgi:hypothetical protein